MELFMRKIIAIFALLVFAPSFYAQEPVAEANDDSELKNLEWNRYVTKNFTIVSINNEQGARLSESIESLKSEALKNWGLRDVKFAKECRVFCVPNSSLLKKLFNLTSPKVQLRKDLNVIWLVLDEDFHRSVSPYITQVAFAEYENDNGCVLPMWFKRGAFRINGSPEDTREALRLFNATARKEQITFSAEQMFLFTEDEYNKQNSDNRTVFDSESLCLCLMLRKEFGEAKLQGFLKLQNRNKPESVLKAVYGFSSFVSFDKKFVSYMKDLTADIVDKVTPDSYLTVSAVR
jgi:hypothetical protein